MIYELTSAPVQPTLDLRRSIPLMTLATDAPFAFEDKYEEKDMPNLSIGRCVPEVEIRRIPKVVYHSGKRRKFIPHTMTPTGQWIVSQTFKDIVESLDPGAHQFFSVTIVNDKDGEPYDELEPRYFWNNCVNIAPWELVDIERSKEKGGTVKYEEGIRPDNGLPWRRFHYGIPVGYLVSKTNNYNLRHFFRASVAYDNNKIRHDISGFFLISQGAFDRLKIIHKNSLHRYPIETSV
jgi:hypothetical protein